MKRNFPSILFLLALLSTGCTSLSRMAGAKAPDPGYFEPSIERGMEVAVRTDEGAALKKYIAQNPVGIKYAPLTGPWPLFLPKDNLLLIPESARRSDQLLGLLLVRGLTTYRLYRENSLPELLVEMEEISAVAQARAAVQLPQPDEAQLLAVLPGRQSLDEMCAYIMEGPAKFLQIVRRDALSSYPEYARPLETLPVARRWLKKMQDALFEGTLAQAVDQHNLDRVRRHTMTEAEAAKESAQIRGADPAAMLRNNREIYYGIKRAYEDLEAERTRLLNSDTSWREKHAALLTQRQAKTARCQYYIPKYQIASPRPSAASPSK